MVKWMLERMKERSTWIGLVTVATSLGAALSPEQINLVVTAGSTIVGLILTMTKDVKQEKCVEVKDERVDTTGAERTEQIGADVGP